ncbi:MAG: hypothetical protein WC284_06350 [Candidimonas sp.]
MTDINPDRLDLNGLKGLPWKSAVGFLDDENGFFPHRLDDSATQITCVRAKKGEFTIYLHSGHSMAVFSDEYGEMGVLTMIGNHKLVPISNAILATLQEKAKVAFDDFADMLVMTAVE